MAGIKDEHNIEALRERLYARNAKEVHVARHSLTDEELRQKRQQSPREWQDGEDDLSENAPARVGPRLDARASMKRSDDSSAHEPGHQASAQYPEDPSSDAMVRQRPKRRYRWYLVIFSSVVLAAGLVYTFFFGITEISSRYIAIDVSVPGAVGAGEEVPIDISIRNDNPVPIVSGTLVIEFPEGSREASDPTRNLRTSRIPLDRIESGSVQNIPIRAIIFGEEGEEKEILARLDYRVYGTNSVLERALDPIVMRITSAPLSLRVSTTEQVAAGQEVDINIDVESNAPSLLSDILVTATYPTGFEFIESSPNPVFGQNVWRIDQLEPGTSATIDVRGVFTGSDRDEFSMDFSAGVPREDNRFAIGSLFATDQVDFLIEQPFFAVDLSINNERGESVAVSAGRRSDAVVRITNTLDSSVYDVRLAARLSGNALDPDEVQVRNGFYDSASNVVRFDVTTDRSLERIAPGETRTFSFQMDPRQVATAQIDVEVDAFARRTNEAQAQEQLVGQTFSSAQYTSVVDLSRSLRYSDGPFGNSGPIPPVAEERTTYTVDIITAAGSNDLLDGRVTLSLPTYVEWLDRYEGPGAVDFNPVNQDLVWNIGAIDADEVAQLQFQVAFQPSRSQIDSSPVLVNAQQFRATDRFTGVVVRDQASVLSTVLGEEEGFGDGNGIVQPRGGQETD